MATHYNHAFLLNYNHTYWQHAPLVCLHVLGNHYRQTICCLSTIHSIVSQYNTKKLVITGISNMFSVIQSVIFWSTLLSHFLIKLTWMSKNSILNSHFNINCDFERKILWKATGCTNLYTSLFFFKKVWTTNIGCKNLWI